MEEEKYFAINRARQYSKITTLFALNQFVQKDFSTEHGFSLAFASSLLDAWELNGNIMTWEIQDILDHIKNNMNNDNFTLRVLFKELSRFCAASHKPVVLVIDEVDSASNNQVFLDFLAQLRAQYIKRFQQPAFQSVVLAGVYDKKT